MIFYPHRLPSSGEAVFCLMFIGFRQLNCAFVDIRYEIKDILTFTQMKIIVFYENSQFKVYFLSYI